MFLNFRRWVKQHKDLITDKSLSIWRVAMDDEGQCYYDVAKQTWVITINKDRSDHAQIEILLHELAHCVATKGDHDKAWGAAYARLYRTIYLPWTEAED